MANVYNLGDKGSGRLGYDDVYNTSTGETLANVFGSYAKDWTMDDARNVFDGNGNYLGNPGDPKNLKPIQQAVQLQNQVQSMVNDYNAQMSNYSKATGTAYIPIATGNIKDNYDLAALKSKLNEVTTSQQTLTGQGKNAGVDLSVTPTTPASTGTTPAAYQPSQAILDVQKKVEDILANPNTVSPTDVQNWQTWLNTQNAASDAQAKTRLQEQFSAIGDLGSSANRQAIAQAQSTTDLGRSQQALSLATQQQSSTNQQIQNSLANLLSVGTEQDKLALIPLQNQFQAYMANLGTSNQASLMNLQNQLNQQNQEAQTAEMMQFYNQNQPQQQQWWQPLVSSGVSVLGSAIGSAILPGIGTVLGSGLGSLFGSSGQQSSSSSYNPLSQLNLQGYNSSTGMFNNTNSSLFGG